ncbi:MAG: helix-turn-helix domain-containing protein [bacterium]
MAKLKGLKLKQISEGVQRGQAVPVEKLGQRLRDVREVLGMTQKQLAKRLGISQPVLSKIEDNAESCSLKTVARVAQGLGCEFLGAIAAKDSLETKIKIQASQKAQALIKRTFANMAMEEQGPEKQNYEFQLEIMTSELMANPRPILWEE